MKTIDKMPGIRTRRRMAGLSVAAAADMIGVTKQTWYDWENGKYIPSAAYLPAIAKLLECRIEELYEDGEEGDDGEAVGQD